MTTILKLAALAASTIALSVGAAQAQANVNNQRGGGLPSWATFIVRHPMEANPFRVDTSRFHGPSGHSGSRLKYRYEQENR
jgi:hypothetical protein